MPGKVFTLGFLYSGEATAALPMPSPSPTAAPESRDELVGEEGSGVTVPSF